MLRPDLQLEKKEGKFSAKTRKEKDETTSIAVEIIYESLWHKKYSKWKILGIFFILCLHTSLVEITKDIGPTLHIVFKISAAKQKNY